MDDDLRKRLFRYVIDSVEGGVSIGIQQLIDTAIDEGYITVEEYRLHEAEILSVIDDHIFDCVICGWTQPVCQMGEDHNGQLACDECSPIDGDEDED